MHMWYVLQNEIK